MDVFFKYFSNIYKYFQLKITFINFINILHLLNKIVKVKFDLRAGSKQKLDYWKTWESLY